MTKRLKLSGLGTEFSMSLLKSPITLAASILFLSTGTFAWSQQGEATPLPAYNVLYTFTGTDGAFPYDQGLTLDSEGNLYGTTGDGGNLTCGAAGCGVVFKIDRTGHEAVLHTFDGTDGNYPFSGVALDEAGNIYGSTCYGGPNQSGVIFKLDRAGNEKVLYTFTGGADGYCPAQGLLRDDRGNLFGITFSGGLNNAGVVFEVDRAGAFTVLYRFTGGADGNFPNGPLIRDWQGNLYGMTYNGGNLSDCGGQGCGVVFKLDRAGNESVLYSFTGGNDGGEPQAGVIRDEAGNLYGTASLGGAGGAGVVFKLETSGKETVLYNFTGGADGGTPSTDLIRDADDNLYSTTFSGGVAACSSNQDCGVVFKLDPTGKETILHTFAGGAAGGTAFSALARDMKGNLYGVTEDGGYFGESSGTPLCSTFGCGVVYKISPAHDH